jgi:hypothetical protein
MRALSHLDLSKNDLGRQWTNAFGDNDRNDDKNYGSDLSGILAVVNATKDNGALSVLSLKDNDLGTKAAGKVLGEMLRVNSVLKELDLSSNKPYRGGDPAGFAQELALGIKDNRALIKLDISSNHIGAEQEENLQRICSAGSIQLAK